MSSKRIRDIIFADEKLLDRYAEQIRDSFAKLDTTEVEASLSLTGPSLKASKKTERVPLKTHEKIDLIEVVFEVQKDLLTSRPVAAQEADYGSGPRFVVETMFATKVILPVVPNDALQGLSHATLWISDPDPALYVDEPYDWRGSFLYLSEFYWGHERRSFLSGVSALQLLVNITQGKDFWSIVREEFEPFGRGRDLHPIDKLKDIGAVVVDRRKIRSLYRIRYFTNEQVYLYEGQKRRVNDIFGYPLYISDES